MKRILILVFIFTASICQAADYRMTVVAAKEQGALALEPTIFHDVYTLKHGEDKSPTDWIPNPSAMLVEIIVDNTTAAQIVADGNYLILSSEVIQPTGGPDVQPVVGDPTLTILPTDIPDSAALNAIGTRLAGYGYYYNDQGQPGALPPCPEGSSPLKCNQLQTGAQITSVQQVQSRWTGMTREQIKNTLIEQMKALPRSAP